MELLQLAPETMHYHCPFNPSHTMPQKTLIKHLIKCPDKLPNYKSCIYNGCHVVSELELENHEENCPDRILFDTTAFEPEDLIRPIPVIDNVPTLEYDESWDGLEQTSDVLKDISMKTISMKAKHGETKSQRKKHRVVLHEHDIDIHNSDEFKQEKSKHNKKSDQTKNAGKIKQLESDVEPLFIGKRPYI